MIGMGKMRFVALGLATLAAGQQDLNGTAQCFSDPGHDYHWFAGLGHAPAKDFGDCCDQCSKFKGCKFFTFGSDKMCWFKDSNKGRRSKPGCTAGGLGPAPAPPAPTPPAPPAPPAPPSPPPIASSPQPTPPATTKPVDVYILMGQSNCVGEGLKLGWKDGTLENAVGVKKMYPYMLNKDGSWAVRSDVRNVFTMGVGNNSFSPKSLQDNEWMTGGSPSRSRIGLEYGLGNVMANFTKNPTMILKSCIGNRALGWDLLPPGSPSWEYGGYTYAGYHGSPEKCKTGTTCKPIGWMAGEQYDGDVAAAKSVLGNLSTYYPGATKYNVKGLFWWQGDKDRYDMGLASQYETHLVALIKSLRKDYEAADVPFVTATLGQTVMGATGAEGAILDAMFAISNYTKYPQFKGTTATVYTHPYARGGASSAHYGLNAEVYMDVAEHMAEAMIGLLKGASEQIISI